MTVFEDDVNKIVDLALKVESCSSAIKKEIFAESDTRKIFQIYTLGHIKWMTESLSKEVIGGGLW